jgi:hypothetical protein
VYTRQASPTAQQFIFPPAHPEKRLASYQEGRLVPPFLDTPRVRLYFMVDVMGEDIGLAGGIGLMSKVKYKSPSQMTLLNNVQSVVRTLFL